MSRTAHPRKPRATRAVARLGLSLDSSSPYVVLTTIHGPQGFWDLVRNATGVMVGVFPEKKTAKLVAKLLAEHERFLAKPAPAAEVLP